MYQRLEMKIPWEKDTKNQKQKGGRSKTDPKDYAVWYRGITGWLSGKDNIAIRILNLANMVMTAVVYVIYVVVLVDRALAGWQVSGIPGGLECVLPYVLIPGISFVLVTIVRDKINEKRPYETWDITPLIPKKTKGHSMPSRHIFSTTMIAMCVLSIDASMGVTLLLLCVFFSYVRVVGGVHYPRDVIAGYLIGVIWGLLLFL